MARRSKEQEFADTLAEIHSDAKYLRRILKRGSIDDRWEAIGFCYWFQLKHYPDGVCNLLVRASDGPRKGMLFTLFAVTDEGTMEFPLEELTIEKTDDALILTFEGREGGYIYICPNTLS